MPQTPAQTPVVPPIPQVVPPVPPPEPLPPQKNGSFAPFIIAAILLAAIASGVAYYLARNPGIIPNPLQPKACTMEAKICPDGTSVGRGGPNCDFAPCPIVVSGSPVAPTLIQGEPEVNKSGLLVPVSYEGEGSAISPDFSNDVVFKNCSAEVARCTYYFLAKDKVASYPQLAGLKPGDKLMITGETVSRGAATGNVFLELVSNIRISK